MNPDEILDRLNKSDVAAERLLDECRAPDLSAWGQRPELYLAFVRRLIEQGHPGRALDLALEGKEHLKDNSLLQYQLALAAARGGNPRYAESILAPILAKALENPRPADMNIALQVDVIALKGRILKDRSTREPHFARESAAWYERAAAVPGAAELPDAGVFPLINAATMHRVAGNRTKSEEFACEVVQRIEHRAEAAAANGDLWPAATLGEALLLLDRHDESIRWYLKAVAVATARGDSGNLASLRNNLRRLEAVGDSADYRFLDEHLGRVVVFTGHMVDSPERLLAGRLPRFPNEPGLIADVATALADALDRLNAKVGFCSLASGGDILFAEAMLARGVELHVVLPFATDDFLRTSVDFGQQSEPWRAWRQRFENVLVEVKRASSTRVRFTTREPFLGSNELFAFSGSVLQGLATLRARERVSEPIALALVDRSLASGAGGTVDFLDGWISAGYTAHEIDLAVLRKGRSSPNVSYCPATDSAAASPLGRPVKAMLFADVAGFSKISETVLPSFLAAYGDYLRELLNSPIGKKAVFANTWGDGLYAVFDRASDAAAFALELVEPTIGRAPEWSRFGLGATTPFRVGLHAGPVFEIPNLFQGRPEFSGQHVSRAARIEPVTVPGCAYASEQLAAILKMEASDRFTIEAVGVHSLAKDYDRCPLYRVSTDNYTN